MFNMCSSSFRILSFVFIFHIVQSSNPYDQVFSNVGVHNNVFSNYPQQVGQQQQHQHLYLQNGQGNGRIYYNPPNEIGNPGSTITSAPAQPVITMNYQRAGEEHTGGHEHGGYSETYGYGYGHHEAAKPYGYGVVMEMEPEKKLGKAAIIKILLAIFPFLLPIIFVPLLLIVIGALLIPFIRLVYFRRDDSRNFQSSGFLNEITNGIIDSISSGTQKFS